MRWFRTMLLALGCMITPALADPTPISGYAAPDFVNDFAGVLSPTQRADLTNRLMRLEQQTTAQVLIVVTRDYADQPDIVPYAERLFEKWRPGQKAKDNGAIIVLNVQSHQDHIQTGAGLGGVLPDASTKQWLIDVRPDLRAGDWALGLQHVLDKVEPAIRGDGSSEAKARPTPASESSSGSHSSVPVVLAILVLMLIGWLVVKMLRHARDAQAREEAMAEATRRRERPAPPPFRPVPPAPASRWNAATDRPNTVNQTRTVPPVQNDERDVSGQGSFLGGAALGAGAAALALAESRRQRQRDDDDAEEERRRRRRRDDDSSSSSGGFFGGSSSSSSGGSSGSSDSYGGMDSGRWQHGRRWIIGQLLITMGCSRTPFFIPTQPTESTP